MFKNNSRLVLIILVFICFVGLFFGVRSYIQWKGNYYFGQVTFVSEGDFILLGLKSREYVVDLADYTVIKKGLGTEVNAVTVGDRVMVVGKINENSHIQASLVRIMGHKNSVAQ